jgi:uncharacterized protein YigE (DUF2233 family)
VGQGRRVTLGAEEWAKRRLHPLCLVAGLALAACSARAALTPPPPAFNIVTALPTPQPPTFTPLPPTVAAPASPVPTATPPAPTATPWPNAVNRFERQVELTDPEDGRELKGPLIGFHLVRDRITFRVHYSPGDPHYISEWAFQLSRNDPPPLLIFPAGFFTQDNLALGLMVSDGDRYSGPYDFGGVFVVQNGQPAIRWLEPQPIATDEQFDQGVQSFPVYVSRGQIPPLNTHPTRATRTVIAQTRSGDFLVLLSLTPLFRTIDLAQWLWLSDLDIYDALNLDGGRSAGYWAGDNDTRDSAVPLPAVIAVYAR